MKINESQNKSDKLFNNVSEDSSGTLKTNPEIETREINKSESEEIAENKNDNKVKTNDLNSSKKEKPNIKFGELYIKCYPWAKVYLNDKFIETTPLTKNITTKTGKYLLTLVHPNYPKYLDSIKITENKLSFVEVNLDTLFGYFYCQVYPWSEIYIDGIQKGVTPLRNPIKL